MNIETAIYTNPDNSALTATLNDGTVWNMPQPCETWHNEYLQAFLADGGVIEPMPSEDEGDPDPDEITIGVTFEQHLEISDARLDALEERVLALERQLEVHHG